MDRIDLLRVFLRVAATRSFSQTADQLGMTRPAVSMAMQQLESRLGVRLLHRTTRNVALTVDGQALMSRAAALVDDMQDLEQRFRHEKQGVMGRLRVDMPGRVARRLVAPRLPQLLAQHPGLEIDLGSSDRSIDLVLENVDCALRVGPLADSSLVAKPLGEMALINCASVDYLREHGVPQAPQELSGHQIINYLSPTNGRVAAWDWLEDGKERSLDLPGRVRVNTAESYIACALAGLGLIQIPRFDVREHLDSGELVEVMPGFRPAGMPVNIVYTHRLHLSRRMQVFIEWVVTCLDEGQVFRPLD